MRRSLIALPLAALALSGCEMLDQGYGVDDGYGPSPVDDRYTDPPVYRAGGTEPFWSLTIDDRAIRYAPATGAPVTVPVPEPIPVTNGERYAADRLQVTIVERECSDGMSDRRFPDTVIVRVDGRTLYGCGGGDSGYGSGADRDAPPPPVDAFTDMPDRIGGDWRVVSIDGRPARSSTLTFEDGRLTGRSCNRLFGDYRAERDSIVVGDVGSTRMACAPDRMDEERALLDALRGPLTVRDSGREQIELIGSDGRRVVLAPR